MVAHDDRRLEQRPLGQSPPAHEQLCVRPHAHQNVGDESGEALVARVQQSAARREVPNALAIRICLFTFRPGHKEAEVPESQRINTVQYTSNIA